MFEELGETLSSAVSHIEASIELLAGDHVAAEKSLRACHRALEEMGDKAFLSTTAAYLAQVIFVQGRSDEAERFTELSEETAASGDIATQAMWRAVRAKVLVRRGRAEEAEGLAREAVTLAARTDFLNHRAEAVIDFADILRTAGRLGEARAALSEGLGLYEQKGNIVAARNARSQFGDLAEVAVPPSINACGGIYQWEP